jgi:hypothetical protein
MKALKLVIEIPEICREEALAAIGWINSPERGLSSSGIVMIIRDPGRKGEPEWGMRILSVQIEET